MMLEIKDIRFSIDYSVHVPINSKLIVDDLLLDKEESVLEFIDRVGLPKDLEITRFTEVTYIKNKEEKSSSVKLIEEKVVFLDIDGVLNILGISYRSLTRTSGSHVMESHLIRRLEFILDKVNDSKIVISSSWGYKSAIECLTKHKFKYIDKIIGETPRFPYSHRGEQIQAYLDKHPVVTSYVVLEDEVIDVCGELCNVIDVNRVIEVDMHEGLSNKDALDAIRKLNDIGSFNLKRTYGLTLEYLTMLLNLGFTANKAYKDIDVLVKHFDTIVVYQDNLTIDFKQTKQKKEK